MLLYISAFIEKKINSNSTFILFKSEIDEEYRKDFTKAARISFTENNSDEYDNDDFELVWRWYIYRKIVNEIQEKKSNLFENNGLYDDFASIITAPINNENNGFMKLIPFIRKGNIEISHTPKLGLELDWDKSGKAKVNFSELVRKADEKFAQLTPGTHYLNIFFDELELNFNTKKQYQRDSKLIRDLIITIEKINSISQKKKYNINLIAAIRSEVQVSISSSGKEINKTLADFGVEIKWNIPVSDDSQPLLHIITERLKNALISASCKSEIDVWEYFFPRQVQRTSTQKYILHNSWYRPRDVIRLLKTAQEQFPNEEKFTHNVLDNVKKKYSEASWIEITEELKTTYQDDEIIGIKRLFYGFKPIFFLQQIEDRINKINKLYPEIEQLLSRHKIQKILIDLYRIGAIGNISNGKFRFVFRGDDEVLLEQEFYVHNALRSYLSI